MSRKHHLRYETLAVSPHPRGHAECSARRAGQVAEASMIEDLAERAPAELFALPVVRRVFECLPFEMVLLDRTSRVAHASPGAGVEVGATASGWCLSTVLRGQPVRDGVVIVRAGV